MKNKQFLVLIAIVLALVGSFFIPSKSASAQTTSIIPPPIQCVVINSNLHFGSSDRFLLTGDVAKLQTFLIARGYLNYNGPRGFYGNLTVAAVRKFQRDHGISTIGRAGPITRNKIQLLTCGVPIIQPAAPTINGIDSPSTLSVGQTGTWTIRATDTIGGGLSYNVVWGDESTIYPAILNSAGTGGQFVQSATFTHRYTRPGAYNPRFYVRGANGQTAETSVSVSVRNGPILPPPVPSPVILSISPVSGTYGTLVTINGSGFTRYGNSINFAGINGVKTGVESYDGRTLQFTIPATPCSSGFICTQVAIAPGTYPISVTNEYGTSASMNFIIVSDQPVTQTVSLNIGQSVAIPNTSLRIKAVKIVDDSRCTPTVTCFWAGRVTVETEVQVTNMIQSFNLSYSGGEGQPVSIADGYSIKITNVSPAARQGGIPTSEYVITYQITR